MKLRNNTSMCKIKERLCKYYNRKPNEPIVKVFTNIFYKGYEIGYTKGLNEGIKKGEYNGRI